MFVARFGSGTLGRIGAATSVPFGSMQVMGFPWMVYVVIALIIGSIITMVYRCIQVAFEESTTKIDPPTITIVAVPILSPRHVERARVMEEIEERPHHVHVQRFQSSKAPPPYLEPSNPDTMHYVHPFLPAAVVVKPAAGLYC